jgi:hypothetical protein
MSWCWRASSAPVVSLSRSGTTGSSSRGTRWIPRRRAGAAAPRRRGRIADRLVDQSARVIPMDRPAARALPEGQAATLLGITGIVQDDLQKGFRSFASGMGDSSTPSPLARIQRAAREPRRRHCAVRQPVPDQCGRRVRPRCGRGDPRRARLGRCGSAHGPRRSRFGAWRRSSTTPASPSRWPIDASSCQERSQEPGLWRRRNRAGGAGLHLRLAEVSVARPGGISAPPGIPCARRGRRGCYRPRAARADPQTRASPCGPASSLG